MAGSPRRVCGRLVAGSPEGLGAVVPCVRMCARAVVGGAPWWAEPESSPASEFGSYQSNNRCKLKHWACTTIEVAQRCVGVATGWRLAPSSACNPLAQRRTTASYVPAPLGSKSPGRQAGALHSSMPHARVHAPTAGTFCPAARQGPGRVSWLGPPPRHMRRCPHKSSAVLRMRDLSIC